MDGRRFGDEATIAHVPMISSWVLRVVAGLFARFLSLSYTGSGLGEATAPFVISDSESVMLPRGSLLDVG